MNDIHSIRPVVDRSREDSLFPNTHWPFRLPKRHFMPIAHCRRQEKILLSLFDNFKINFLNIRYGVIGSPFLIGIFFLRYADFAIC